MDRTWGCVVSTKDYLQGAYNLYESLNAVNTVYDFILIIDNNISEQDLCDVGFKGIKYYTFQNLIQANVLDRVEQTINKIHVFNIMEYEKIGLIDADIIVTKNIDHYMDYVGQSAFLQSGYTYGLRDDNYIEDYHRGMNGSVLIITPSEELYKYLLDLSSQCYNDEEIWLKAFPNFIFQPWKHLPLGDWRGSKEQERLIHYDGFPKYWMKGE